jgi:hypothetical protein
MHRPRWTRGTIGTWACYLGQPGGALIFSNDFAENIADTDKDKSG